MCGLSGCTTRTIPAGSHSRTYTRLPTLPAGGSPLSPTPLERAVDKLHRRVQDTARQASLAPLSLATELPRNACVHRISATNFGGPSFGLTLTDEGNVDVDESRRGAWAYPSS